MKYIDINDLEYWSGNPESKFDLALIISRLIRATTPKITKLIIPKGKSIFRGGWDAIVISSEASEFVPEGVSLWEFGTDDSPSIKAEREYQKRTNNPLNEVPANSTFVFVTTRTWEKKQDWIDEKLNEGTWKSIKVIDGGLLVEWLLMSPIQSQDLANRIGKNYSISLETPEQFWENWSIGPNGLKVTPSLLTVGRETEMSSLFQLLKEQNELIVLKALTKEEAIAFFVASILESEDFKEELLATSIIVEDYGDFKTLIESNRPLVLLPIFNNLSACRNALAKGHRILIPVSIEDQIESTKEIILPRIGREKIVSELQVMGLSEIKARALSKETSRNITVIRRYLKFDGTKPEWASKDYYSGLLPALLAGRWDDSNDGDRFVIEHLSNQKYDDYISTLTKWTLTPDSPIINIGSKWRLTSSLDAWTYLSHYLSKPQIDLLAEAFKVACSEIKPALSLEANQRYLASFFGKTPEFSKYLREGLCQSLILIGIYGNTYQLPIINSQSWVDLQIRELFQKQDFKLWQSLDDITPLIAEASPASFLSAIEKFIVNSPGELVNIFEEANSPIFSSYYHTGLLWALEGLAWMSDHLLRVSLVLLRLDQIDPGVKILNRPINSLKSIFLGWMPQTFASLPERKQVIETIKQKDPDLVWRLCERLMPFNSIMSTEMTHKLRWRATEHESKGVVSVNETYEFNSFVGRVALACCDLKTDRIVMLLECLNDTLSDDRLAILAYVKDNFDKIDDKDNLIWNKLKNILHRYNQDDWEDKMSAEDIEKVKDLYQMFAPKTEIGKLLWIFDTHWPEFPDALEEKIDFRDQEEYVQKKRNEALLKIYKSINYDEFLALASSVKEPGVFGFTAQKIGITAKEALQFCLLVSSDDIKAAFAAAGFIRGYYFDKGIDESLKMYEKIASAFDSDCCTEFLLALPPDFKVWQFVERLEEAIYDGYWKKSKVNFWNKEVSEQEYQLNILAKFSRYGSCLEICYFDKENHKTSTIIDILKKLATEPDIGDVRPDYHHIEYLLEELYKRADCNETELGNLEWLYMPILRTSNRGDGKILHKELARNPNFFVEVLMLMYRPEGSTDDTKIEGLDKEFVVQRAQSAHKLLDSWKLVPGTSKDTNGKATLDGEVLRSWVTEARQIAASNKRQSKADLFIGKILSQFPEGDEHWPPDDIASIIDTIGTEELITNFRIGVSNKRSYSSRSPFDGGKREKNLAAYFRKLSKGHLNKHPITASILEDLAKKYEIYAKQEDNEAKENDLDY